MNRMTTQSMITPHTKFSFRFKTMLGMTCSTQNNSMNILDEEIYLIYDNEIYELKLEGPYYTQTRYYMPFFYGFAVLDRNDTYKLSFGEFDSTRPLDDSFKIYWGDGSMDEVEFSHKFETDGTGKSTINETTIWLNGAQVENDSTIRRYNYER